MFQKNVEDLRTKVRHGDPTQIQTFELTHAGLWDRWGKSDSKLPVSYCWMGQSDPRASGEKANN